MAFDLKTATPDGSFPSGGFLFGADSQSASDPSVYSRATAATGLFAEAGLAFASNLLELRNGTNAQTFDIYNTYTDASNYERGFMRWSSNVLEIGTEAAGTGTARTTRLSGGGNPKIEVQASDLYLKGLNADINLDNNVTINTYTYMYLQYRNGNQIRIGASDIISYVDSKFQANVEMTALPTSDPAVAGRLWNDAGTLKVSAG